MNYAMKLTRQDFQEAIAVQNEFERTVSVIKQLGSILRGIGYIFTVTHKAKSHLRITHNVGTKNDTETTHYLSGHRQDLKELKELIKELSNQGDSVA